MSPEPPQVVHESGAKVAKRKSAPGMTYFKALNFSQPFDIAVLPSSDR